MNKILLVLVLVTLCFAEYTVDARAEMDEAIFAPPPGATLEATADLNVRATPCTDGRLIVTIKSGARVTYANEAKQACGYTWWKVNGGFGVGWAASNWLRTVGSGGQRINDRGLNLIKVSHLPADIVV